MIPPNGWFINEHSTKLMIGGYPHFRKWPYNYSIDELRAAELLLLYWWHASGQFQLLLQPGFQSKPILETTGPTCPTLSPPFLLKDDAILQRVLLVLLVDLLIVTWFNVLGARLIHSHRWMNWNCGLRMPILSNSQDVWHLAGKTSRNTQNVHQRSSESSSFPELSDHIWTM